MDKKEIFDQLALEYEAWFEKNKYAYQSELEAIRRVLPKTGPRLEVGSGTGRFAVPLGIKLGIEPSEEMARIAKQKGMEVIKGVAESLPFPDAHFGFILMVTAICFFDDVEAALKEAWRVLKSGGSLIIGFIDANSPLGRNYQEKKDKSRFYRQANFFSADEVISLLKKSNFNQFYLLQTIFRPPEEIKEAEPVKEGCGEGLFVVVRAVKVSQ
ncbi:MAG: class I SAM-dependent methyltransferase [Candidatus Saccharicenans sp.]|nr:MAG: SAM-dependent methyltransferase [Candidatus Aminicenantes bacterium]HEK85466.1 class I SAM-dependent methyltransferase [Candidatus Aminicenantes bacterium]